MILYFWKFHLLLSQIGLVTFYSLLFPANIFKLVFYFIKHSMSDWFIICPLSEVVVNPCLWSLLVFVHCFLVYLVSFDLCTAQSYLKFYWWLFAEAWGGAAFLQRGFTLCQAAVQECFELNSWLEAFWTTQWDEFGQLLCKQSSLWLQALRDIPSPLLLHSPGSKAF